MTKNEVALDLLSFILYLLLETNFFNIDITPDHLLLDSAPNIGPFISRLELENFKNAETKALEPLKS
jgi:hypothetical protein